MAKKLFLFITILFFLNGCFFFQPAPPPKPLWVDLSPKPSRTPLVGGEMTIENRDVFELLTPQKQLAIHLILGQHEFVELTAEEAQLLVGYTYTNQANKRIFLIRAIGGSGNNSFSIKDNNLYLFRGALGQAFFYRSALVVNLDFVPNYLYLSYATDM